MSNVNLYAPFAGVKDGLTLLTMLQDKKKLAETLGIVKILDDRIAEINQAIEVYGKTSEIDKLLRKAAENNAEAEKTLTEATVNSETVRDEAKHWADALNKKSKTRKADVKQREDAADEDKRLLENEKARFTQESKIAEARIAKDEQAATSRLEEATALRARYQKILDDMKAGAAAA